MGFGAICGNISTFAELAVQQGDWSPKSNRSRRMNYLTPEQKQELFAKYGKSKSDTGSAESQIALFSYRINHLTEHLKGQPKDHVTQLSLLKLVGKRRRLLKYLERVDIARYRAIKKELELR